MPIVYHFGKCLQIVGTPDSPLASSYTVSKIRVLELAYNRTYDRSYLQQAITQYQSLLVKMPNNDAILNNLAFLLAENDEKLEKALEYAERAHQARPDYPVFLDTLAYVLYKNGRFSEADVYIHASIQQYEQGRMSAPAEVYEHLGMIKEKLGAVSEARGAYEQALKIGGKELSEPVVKRINQAIEHLPIVWDLKNALGCPTLILGVFSYTPPY